MIQLRYYASRAAHCTEAVLWATGLRPIVEFAAVAGFVITVIKIAAMAA